MKYICIISLSILIISCNNFTNSKDEYGKLNQMAGSFYSSKFGCETAYFYNSQTYSSDLNLKHTSVVLNLCHCDSLLKKEMKNITEDTIINTSKFFFKKILDSKIKYYSINIYDDYNRNKFNKAINLEYDSIKKDFIFYSHER